MAITVKARVDTSGWGRSADELLARLNRATHEGVNAGLALAERETKINLVKRSHPRGTKTPSAPGQPPAMISGHLARSVRTEPASPSGRYRWSGKTGATTVYARIQQLGGWAGRGHRSYLPPRPYLVPLTRSARSRMTREIRKRWSEVIISAR